jgi:hypothetical protein
MAHDSWAKAVTRSHWLPGMELVGLCNMCWPACVWQLAACSMGDKGQQEGDTDASKGMLTWLVHAHGCACTCVYADALDHCWPAGQQGIAALLQKLHSGRLRCHSYYRST